MAIDVCFEGTGGVVGTDYNPFSFFIPSTSGSENKMTAGKEYFRLDFGELKRYDENGTAVAYGSLKLGQWYTLYAPIVDGFELTTSSFARLFASQPIKTTEDGASPNYWIRNFRFSELPVKIVDGSVLGVTEDNVGQFAGDGWTLTKAPAGVHVIAGNQISLTVAGEYTATNGTQTVNFSILPANVIAALTTAASASALTTMKNTGSVSFDETMGAAKFTFTAPNTSWYENQVGFYKTSAEFMRMQAGRASNEYTWMAFDLQFEGTGGRGTDFNNFLIFPTGNTNKTNAGQYYQGHFGEIRRYNTNNVAVALDQMKSGQWYTIYVPLTEANQIDSNGAFFTLLAMNPIVTTNEDGSKTAKNANFWVRNVRFESGLPTA
jgi:hypothetical protein